MSRKKHYSALEAVRNWSSEDVLTVLIKNDLGECTGAFKKHGIDGDSLLNLTEVKLALWKRDLNLKSIRKLTKFVEDLKQFPNKYLIKENGIQGLPISAAATTTTATTTTTTSKEIQQHPTPLKGFFPTRSVSSSSYSDTGSWDTDFDDDDIEDGPSEKLGNGTKKESKAPVLVPDNFSKTVRRGIEVDENSGSSLELEIPDGIASKSKVLIEKGINANKHSENIQSTKKKIYIPDAFNSKSKAATSISKTTSKLPSHGKEGMTKGLSKIQSSIGINHQSGSQPSKPIVPSRPPTLAPKPVVPPSDKKWSLPKPPTHIHGSTENVKEIINNLNLPTIENKLINNKYDDEFYESLDKESFPELNNIRALLSQSEIPSSINQLSPLVKSSSPKAPSIPLNQSDRPVSSTLFRASFVNQLKPEHSSNLSTKHLVGPTPPLELITSNHKPSFQLPHPPALPRHNTSTYEDQEYEICDESESPFISSYETGNGYESEEYESIEEHMVRPSMIVDGIEYYLQPVSQQSQQELPQRPDSVSRIAPDSSPPPLPAKPRPILPDVVVPTVRPPSPPRSTKQEDYSSSSAGSSGDGVSGKIGGLFWNLLSRPGSSASETREKSPSQDVKKTATQPLPLHKPPPVDQRPVVTSSAQGRPLPLPPTHEGSKEKPAASSGYPKTVFKSGYLHLPYYHNVDRQRGEELLKNGEDGCFLVRPSSKTQNPLTLTLWFKKRLYNISVRQRSDGKFALGTEKPQEQFFSSVEALIMNYQSEKLVLYSGGERTGRTLLTTSPKRDS